MSKNGGGQKRIERLRRRIDGMDNELLRLLYSRAGLAIEIGHLKRKKGIAAYSPGRERAILARVTKMNGGPLQQAAVKRIFREIVRESRLAAIREVLK